MTVYAITGVSYGEARYPQQTILGVMGSTQEAVLIDANARQMGNTFDISPLPLK